LAAILFPVFAQAREKARAISCMSNLKQSGLATLMYVQDYDETFPMSLFVDLSVPCTSSFYNALTPYQKNADIMRCPSKPQALDMNVGWPTVEQSVGLPPLCVTSPPVRYLSYNFNFAVIEDGSPSDVFGVDASRTVKTLASIPYPVVTSLIYDGVPSLYGIYDPSGSGESCAPFDSPVDARHTAVLNSNYVDGHAKAVHAKPDVDANNTQYTCAGLDGQVMYLFTVTDQGPYQNSQELWGVPQQNSNGSWTLVP
jgi:hypothetical protein